MKYISLFGLTALLAFGAGMALAEGPDINYPVTELGGCESSEACFLYCAIPQNAEKCYAFAERNNLIPEEDREIAKALIEGGPGDCRSEKECEEYCDDPANGEECLDFAVEYGLIAEEEAVVTRTVLQEGGPGGCQTEPECMSYCDNPAHAEECFAFAREHDLIPEEEIEIAHKVMTEGGPGGCYNKQSCEAYCDNPDHIEECVMFAVENGMMSEEEAQQILATGGVGPGGCQGRECEDYCEDPAHELECTEFAIAHGLIPADEAEMALMVAREGGPGGCRGKQECENYCDNPEHGDECFQYGLDHGLIPDEEIEMMRKMIDKEGPGGCRGRECEAYCENPDHADECMQFAIDNGFMTDEEAGRMKKDMELMRRGGPGGCMGPRECDEFCRKPENGEICMQFAIDNDLIPPEERGEMERHKMKEKEVLRIVEEQGGPGGCRGKTECMNYCGQPGNQEECDQFMIGHGVEPPAKKHERMRREEMEMEGEVVDGPGGCVGSDECVRYCLAPENKLECMEFTRQGRPEAVPGLGEHPEMMPSWAGGPAEGPGGCGSARECFDYCEDPANAEECGNLKLPPIEGPEEPRVFRCPPVTMEICQGIPLHDPETGCRIGCERFPDGYEPPMNCPPDCPEGIMPPGFKPPPERVPRPEVELPVGCPPDCPDWIFDDEREDYPDYPIDYPEDLIEIAPPPGTPWPVLDERERGYEYPRGEDITDVLPGIGDEGWQEEGYVPPFQQRGEKEIPEWQRVPEEYYDKPEDKGTSEWTVPEGHYERVETEHWGGLEPVEDWSEPAERQDEPREYRRDEPTEYWSEPTEYRSEPTEYVPEPTQYVPEPAPAPAPMEGGAPMMGAPEAGGGGGGGGEPGPLYYSGPRTCRSVTDCLTMCALSGSITDCRMMLRYHALVNL